MLNLWRFFTLLCACLIITSINYYIFMYVYGERTKPMSKNSINTKNISWIDFLKKQTANGQFSAHDKTDKPIILEYHILNAGSPEFTTTMRSIADITARTFTTVELEFLKQYPQALTTEPLYKPYAELVQKDVIDWTTIEKAVHDMIYHMYHDMDWSTYGTDDIYIFIIARDPVSQALLGTSTFFARPSYTFGTCKCIAISVEPTARKRGLSSLLMSVIFRIIPETQHIFLDTRTTNTQACALYTYWGFVQNHNPEPEDGYVFESRYWIFFDYLPERSDILQKTSQQLTYLHV